MDTQEKSSFKAHRAFLGEEFEITVSDVDSAGLAVLARQTSSSNGGKSHQFARVFTRHELRAAGLVKTLEGYVALVDALELVEDAYFTEPQAVAAGLSVFAAYQLSATLPGVRSPPPIVSQEAARAYFARAPVGLGAWNDVSQPENNQLMLDVVAQGLTELCRHKPAGQLAAVQWLAQWLLSHNPTQPNVVVE